MKAYLDNQDCYNVLNDGTTLPEVDIPVKADNRKKTDVWFLVVFASFAIIVIPFLIYTLSNANIGRLSGSDSCGNNCGRKNDKIEGLNCSGQDMTDKPIYVGHCISEDEFSSPDYFYHEPTMSAYFYHNTWKLILLSLFPLALSLALTKFLRYATAVAVWILLVISWLSLIAMSVLLWLTYAPAVLVVLLSVAALLFICVVIYNIKKMRLVILVLRESAKALCRNRVITYVSICAFFLEAFILLISIIIFFYLSSAAHVLVGEDEHVYYFMDDYMAATIVLFAILLTWVVHFVIGVHNTILSGAVIRGYFTRRQIDVKEAVITSLLVTVKNHLGTVALQSLLFCIVTPFVLLLYPFKLFSFTTDLVDRILKYTDSFVSRNVCVVTAMHGTSFCQSGRKAVELNEASLGDTIAIGDFSNFVITMTQFIVICVSFIVTFFSVYTRFYIEHSLSCCFILLGYSYIATNTILESFKTASATVHLCVAQDCLINKEEAKPYNMSIEQFLDGSYELFATKVKNQPPPPVDDA